MKAVLSKCTRCGWSLAAGEVVCSRCGVDLGAADPLRSLGGVRVRSITDTLESELFRRLRTAVLGEYELVGRVGRGGMCAVYLAQDLQLDREVAIKVVIPEMVSGYGIAQERLKREARTAASLAHPNIIPVYAVRETDDLVFLVMQHVRGRPLDVLLRGSGPLPPEIVQSVLHQVGSGLEYAHRRRVVHRDIKPANIMIDDDGWALLMDFGIARVGDGSDITASGAAIGTPCYMSPEQCSGLQATAASDQYSLGIVAYEMLTGRPPFLGDSVASVVTQHLFERPKPIDDVAPECPPQLAAAVSRMLEKSPDQRWPSLKEALGQMGGVAMPYADIGRAQMANLVQEFPAADLEERFATPYSPSVARSDPSGGMGTPEPAARSLARRALTVASIVALSVAVSLTVQRLADRFGASAEPREEGVAAMPDGRPADSAQPAAPPMAPAAVTPSTATATAPPRQTTETRRSNPPPAPRAAAPVGTGTILLGTRGASALLYVDGEARGVIDRLRDWESRAGSVRLSIRAEGCEPWDSTVVVQPGSEVRIGYRTPRCPS